MTYDIEQKGKMYHISGTPYSFNNKKTAEHLAETLQLIRTTNLSNNIIDHKLDKITKHIIQLKLSIGTLEEEIQTLEEMIKKC